MSKKEKKELLEDILSALEKNNKNKNEDSIISEITKSEIIGTGTDITEIEDSIPLVNNEEGDQGEEIVLINEENSKDRIEKLKEKKEEIKKEDNDKNLDKETFIEYINKIEKLEHEKISNEKLIDAQAKEIEKIKQDLERIQIENKKLEEENNKIKNELSNSERNIKLDLESELSKAKITEEKYQKLYAEHEELKARIRRDLKKLKFRENELSNKLELIKQDSDTLLKAKDQKILQLRKQISDMEFEFENLKEKINFYKDQAKEYKEKAERVVKALKLSTTLLEDSKKKD